MDNDPSIHPIAETLEAYGLGKLDHAEAEVVGKHLEGCPECQSRLTEITNASSEYPAAPLGFATSTDHAPVGSSSLPAMSSTGQADETSDTLDSQDDGILQRGTRVGYFGDYELLKVLGEGGMGIVYRARQISLNRSVALKMIKASRFPSADEVRRFHNESEAVARLDHPNIVPIFEVGQYEDQHYFSMKLVAGESLDKRPRDCLSNPRRAAELVAKIADAIHHAHQRGILHRDLKPANILIDSEGQPHVTDFGLAKRVEGDSELTRSGAILGTPAYMAPEQASGKRGTVTTSTDVYGLGAILFALLAGRAPFGGTTVLDVLEQVRERTPDSPRKSNPRVPRDLEVICLKCLEKDPPRRYASAHALAGDLKRWLSGEPIAARPVGNAARLWMWCHRNPIVAGAANLATAALVFAAVMSLLYARQQARLAETKTLYGDEQNRRATDQAQAAERLQYSLADSNRRLAMLHFERAQRAFDSGQVNHGLRWLVECWRYSVSANDRAWQHLAEANLALWRYYCPELKGVLSHPSEVRCVTFSPDGRKILTGSEDGTARLWDVTTARPIGQVMLHGSRVSSLAFSPEGKTVLTGSVDKTARLWDAATGLPVGKPLEHQDAVYAVAFSPDGKMVLTGCWDSTARLWDVATAKPIGQPLRHSQPVTSVAFSPDGKAVLTSSVFTAHLWDAVTTQPIGQPMQHIHRPGSGAPLFSPSGNTILTNAPRLWNAATALPISKPLKPFGVVTSMAFSPDGKTVLTGSSDRTARLWDATTAEPIGHHMDHQAEVSSVAFSPDGKTVLTGSHDDRARLWDAATGLSIGHPFEHQAAVTAVAYSPDAKTVLTVSGDNTARLWDAATAEPIGQPLEDRDRVTFALYSPDGKTILVGSSPPSTARLRDATSLRPIGQPIINQDYINSLAFSPDGKTLLTASRNTARQWDADTAKPIGQTMWHQGRVMVARYSPDGRTILTGGSDCAARLWDASTGQPVGQPLMHEGAVRYGAFSPSGKTILTGSEDKTARLWDVATAQPIGKQMVHRAPVTWAAYATDGKTVLTMAGDTARLWDSASALSIGKPLKHQGAVSSMAFSPDSKTILTGSTDNAARLWDATTGEPISRPLRHGAGVQRVTYSPDGTILITGSEDGTARLWDAATAMPIGRPLEHQEAVPRLWDAATALPTGQSTHNQTAVTWLTCSPDSKTIVTGTAKGTARLWQLPAALNADLQTITTWVDTITGLSVDDQGAIYPLDSAAWQARRERLRQLGGPPKSNRRRLLDPILNGPDPTARARAWMTRKRWTEAEVAFDEAVRARPLSGAVLRERGTFHDSFKRNDKGDDDFVRAYAHGDILFIRMRYSRGPIIGDTIGRYISDRVVDRARVLFPGGATGLSTELFLGRAEQLVKTRRWNEARATLIQTGELPLGLPEDSMLLEQRGDLFALMGCWHRAAADYREVIERWPEGHPIRHRQILSLLAAGDRGGLRHATADLLDRFRKTTDPEAANDVVWYCVAVPSGVADHEALIRLAELALKGYDPAQARFLPNPLGAALYRVGRFADAIRLLEEEIQLKKGREQPANWAFLAMAHFRVGHEYEARRWLDQFKNYHPSGQPDVHFRDFWDDLETRLLLSEAKAVVLFDPNFPADPFAR